MSSFNDINRITAPRKSFGRSAAASVPVRPVQAQRIAAEPVRAAATPILTAPQPLLSAGGSFAEGFAEEFESHRVILRSLALIGRNGVTVLVLIAAAVIPERVMFHMIQTDLLSPILTWLSCLVLYVAVFHVAFADLRGEKLGLAGALRAVGATSAGAYIPIAVTILSVWFLAAVTVSAANAALAAPVAILEAKGWREARARSAAMIAPCRARVRLLLLLLAGLACARGLALLPVWHLPAQAVQLFLQGGWLFPQALTALCAVAGAALYHEVAAMNPGAPR